MRLQVFLAFTLFHCALPYKGTSYGIPALFDTLKDLSDEDETNPRTARKHARTLNDPEQVPLTSTSTITPTKPSKEPDNFGILEPFPRNIFAIELTSANVTCVAYDSLGIKIPEKFIFVRRDKFGGYHELTSNGKLYFTKRTEENGRKLFVTLHFLYLTMADDSRYGPYECDAFAVNDPVARKHGFSVTVFRELPVSSTIHPRPSTVAVPPASRRIPPKPSTASPVFMSSQVLPTPSAPTLTPTTAQVSSPECLHYKNLTNFDRARGYKGAAKCDRSLSRGWYRFQGRAGKQMPDSCVPKQRCGTHAPGWLRGGHPTVAEGAVERKVCFHWSSGCCQLSTNIRVRNCGAFYVYRLYPPPACSLRYCGDGEQAPPSAPECSFYMVLDELDRSQGYIGVGKCDRSLPKSWYRFQGSAGKQMPQSCVPKHRCGTHAPGWLDGRHPKVSEGAVKRKVCFHWSQSCCRYSSTIRVRNCGAFYVYELDSTRFCSLRYCGDRM